LYSSSPTYRALTYMKVCAHRISAMWMGDCGRIGVAPTYDLARQLARSCRGGRHSVIAGAAAKMSTPGSVSSTSRLKINILAK
jgi:hypothetical protein